MTTPGPAGEYVTWRRGAKTGVSARGNDVIGFTPVSVGPCAFVPGAEAEAAVGTEQVTADAVLYAPAGTPVSPLDQVERDNGEIYQVTGELSAWSSPWTGIKSPISVRLRRVTGAAAHLGTNAAGG